TRSSVILNGGKRYRYPLELDDVVKQFGAARGARAIASYARQWAVQKIAPSKEETFSAWVTHRFGRDLYRTFFGPYTAKLWGLDPDQISADWAAERISIPSLAEVMLRLVKVNRPEVRTYARRYLYPRFGIGQIFERGSAELERRGGHLLLGAEV